MWGGICWRMVAGNRPPARTPDSRWTRTVQHKTSQEITAYFLGGPGVQEFWPIDDPCLSS